MGKRTEKQLAEPVRGQEELFSETELWNYKYGENKSGNQSSDKKGK